SLAVSANTDAMQDSSCSNDIPISPNNMQATSPAIYRENIVWISDYQQVMLFNSNGTSAITDANVIREDPAIFENAIVWIEYNPDAQVIMCDLRNNGYIGGCLENDTKTQVTSNMSLKLKPKIGNNSIGWHEYDGHDFEIMMCDRTRNGLSDGCLMNDKKIQLTKNNVDDTNIDLTERYVVWQIKRAISRWDIVLHDRETNETKIFKEKHNQENPVIKQEHNKYKIVYWTNEEGNEDSMLRTKQGKKKLINSTYDEWNPIINKEKNEMILWFSSKTDPPTIEGLKENTRITMKTSGSKRINKLALFENVLVFEATKQGRSKIWMTKC
ncbi:MAG: hypothetical protein Q8L34_05675, partial [Candidatus Woesearchaeota archaeon]|nr:hypothetical protein [Candidatus Woesearchaeota archaeon]